MVICYSSNGKLINYLALSIFSSLLRGLMPKGILGIKIGGYGVEGVNGEKRGATANKVKKKISSKIK